MTQSDVPAVAALSRQLGYAVTPQDVGSRMAGLLDGGADALFVAERDGAVIGWSHLRASGTLTSAPRAELMGLVVAQAARRHGVGRLLVHHGEAWARAAGYTAIRVRCEVSRLDAHAFYAALGYRAVKRQDVFDRAL